MAVKRDLGLGPRTKERKIKRTDASAIKTNSVDLVGGLIPEGAPVPKKAPERTKYVNFEDIYVNEKNDGLSMNEIDRLADSISRVGLQQPLLVLQDEKGKYRLISGHRRYHAISLLKEKSNWTGKIECKEVDLDDLDINLSQDSKEMYALLSGNLNREKTPQDRLFEMKQWERLYQELKENGVTNYTGLDGVEYELKKAREYISQMSGMSSGDLARLKKIDNHATQEVVEALNEGLISVNTASDISSLSGEKQNEYLNNLRKEEESSDHENKGVQLDTSSNLNLQSFNNDIKTIKKKVRSGINLSGEDLDKYHECLTTIIEILNKY